MLKGKLAGGDFGVRVSVPGADVFGEGFGSRNISFDSRISEIGTVVACGLIQCGAGQIFFPNMPYIPICSINEYDGSSLYSRNKYFKMPTGGVASAHTLISAIAISRSNSIEVVAYQSSNYSNLSYDNPNGRYYLYTVFANGG